MSKTKLYIFLTLWTYSSAYHQDAYQMKICPGLYCGRQQTEYGNWTECGACPKGFRANDMSLCEKCDGTPTFYDWMYLGFMALLAPALHSFFIDITNRYKRKQIDHCGGRLVVLHVSGVLECGVAAVLTLLLMAPLGSTTIDACPVHSLADWYTMFFNPSPDYVTTIHCTVEAVYPRYTLVMVYYALCVVMLMLVRPLLSTHLVQGKGRRSIYAALYFLPILLVTHAVFAGVLYYSFPYIILGVSVITNAAHFASFKDQSALALVRVSVRSVRNVLIVLCHWLLHAYGIVAITQLTHPPFHASLLALVPFPTLFYLLTVRFTHPDKLELVS